MEPQKPQIAEAILKGRAKLEPRILNEEQMVYSISSAGKTGYSHVKEYNLTPNLHHSQKLTQNGLKTQT